MIVTCEECSTQFRLDDAKVPARGVRVRCSRCKHAFFVAAPGASRDERDELVQAAAEDAVAGRPASGPEVTQDLCAPTGEPSGAAGPAADGRAAASTPGEGGSSETIPSESAPSESTPSESDWEFGDDFPGSGEPEEAEPSKGLSAAREAVDDLLGPAPEPTRTQTRRPAAQVEGVGGGVDDLLGHGLGAEPPAEAPPESLPGEGPPAVEAAVQAPAVDLDSDSGWIESTPAADLGLDADSASDSGWTGNAPTAAPESESDWAEEEPVEPPEPSEVASELQAAQGSQGEELGSPDAWDFFAHEDKRGGESGEGGVVLGAIRTAPQSALRRSGEESAEDTKPSRAVEAVLPLPTETSAGSVRLRRVGHGAGWVATVALCVAALYGALVPTPGPNAVATSKRLAGVEAASLEGYWLENAVAGPIYVVAGALRSTALGGGPVGGRLDVQLLDAGGAAIEAASAALGPALPVEALREHDLSSLVTAQERAAQRLARAQLAPGQRQPVHAIFAQLPPEAVSFRLQAQPVPAVEDESSTPVEPGAPESDPATPGAGTADPGGVSLFPSSGGAGAEAGLKSTPSHVADK